MEIITGYYSAGSVSLSPKTDVRTLESVIMAVWSQQWPRLRASFSFRTAAVRERRKSELVSFDVRVNGPAARDGARLHCSIEMPPTAAWVAAAGDDAQSQTVTPLRRFLWRYGRDVVNSKKHFRTLVQLFLDAEASGSELPTTAAAWLFREIPDPSDGETLKRDLLGFTRVAVPLCPAVSATGMLELLATTWSKPVFTAQDVARRLSALPTAQFGQLTKYALLHERSLGRWSEIINSAIVASADLRSLQGDLPASTRLRILLSRPDLVHSTTIDPLSNEDILHLASKYRDSQALAALSFVAVRRDFGFSQSTLLQSTPGPIFRAAVDAEIRIELHHSWTKAIRNGAHQILEIDWLDGLTKTSQLSVAIRLLGFPRDSNTTSEKLANIIFAMDDDASGGDRTNLLSFLLTEAFKKPAASGWRLVSLALAELRPLVLQGALPSPSFNMLADTLPRAGADPWDLNKRILLALHNLTKSCPDDNGVIGALNLSEKEMQVVINGPEHDFGRQKERSWNWF
jgi:hypothetical protein